MAGRVMVDFDGVLHSYVSGWTGPVPTDPPTHASQDFVCKLMAMGFEVVVFTTRADTAEGLMGTRSWLALHAFPAMTITGVKLPAIAYVDDRAVVCRPVVGGPGFRSALARIQALAG